MFDNIRILKWSAGILKFPCGVTVEISEEKMRKLLTMFKLENGDIDNLFTSGEITMAKGKAFQIRHHVT
jgi:hypothetical protein